MCSTRILLNAMFSAVISLEIQFTRIIFDTSVMHFFWDINILSPLHWCINGWMAKILGEVEHYLIKENDIKTLLPSWKNNWFQVWSFPSWSNRLIQVLTFFFSLWCCPLEHFVAALPKGASMILSWCRNATVSRIRIAAWAAALSCSSDVFSLHSPTDNWQLVMEFWHVLHD